MAEPSIIRHDDIPAFLDAAPVSAEFRKFVHTTKPLVGPDRDPEIVILSNGTDSAGAFAYRARQVWQMFLEFLPQVEQPDMVDASRAMVAWMFEHGAHSIFSFGRPGDTRWQDFHRAIGARSLEQHDEHEIFEITRRMH